MNRISELIRWVGYLMLSCMLIGFFLIITAVGSILLTVLGFVCVIFIVAFVIKEIIAEQAKKGPN